MANNKSIQILRGNSAQIVAAQANEQDTDKLLPGQMLYNTDKGYLTIGKEGNSAYTQLPIKSRELIGYYGDDTSIGVNNSLLSNNIIYGINYNAQANTLNIFSELKLDSEGTTGGGGYMNISAGRGLNISSGGLNIHGQGINLTSSWGDLTIDVPYPGEKHSLYVNSGGDININSKDTVSLNSNTMSVKALGDINIISSPSDTPPASINLSSGKAILTSENGMELNAYSGGLNIDAFTGGGINIYGDGVVGVSSFNNVSITSTSGNITIDATANNDSSQSIIMNAHHTNLSANGVTFNIGSTAPYYNGVTVISDGNISFTANDQSMISMLVGSGTFRVQSANLNMYGMSNIDITTPTSGFHMGSGGTYFNSLSSKIIVPTTAGTLALKSDIQPNYYTHYVRMIGNVGSTSMDLTFWYQGTSNSNTTVFGSIAAQLYDAIGSAPVPCTGRVTPSGQSQTGAYSIYARTRSSLQYYTINGYVGNITGDPASLGIAHHVYSSVKTY